MFLSKRQFQGLIWTIATLAMVPFIFYLAGFLWYPFYGLSPFAAGFYGWYYGIQDFFTGFLPGQGGLLLATFVSAFFLTYGFSGALLLLAYNAFFKRELHGSASWASYRDLRSYKLFAKTGIIVGKLGRSFLRFGGQQFVILLAPTRSGKGVSLVIPNLLELQDSVAVLDVKLENFKRTSLYREKVLGHKVFLFAPFAEDLNEQGEVFPFTHRYNPLSIVRSGVFREGDILSVATILYPNTDPKNQFWTDQARNLFLCLCLLLMDLRDQRSKEGACSKLPDYPITIGEILRQSGSRGLALSLSDYLKSLIANYTFWSTEFLEVANAFMSNPPDTLGNIKSSFDAPLINWRSAIFDAATSESDFDLRRVRKDKMSIYLGIPPGRIKESPVIVRLFFTQLINLNTEKLKSDDAQIKHPCVLILDETPSIGRLPIIKDGSGYVAGYDLRYVIIAQSIAQLEDPELYGRYGTKTIIDNSGLQIVFPPKNNEDAKTISESLGYLTERSSSMSRGGGILSTRSESTNTSDQRRALMMPQEVKTMAQDEQIILMEYAKPIRCKKIKYYEDPHFIPRLTPGKWAKIPPVAVMDYRQATRGAIKPLDLSQVDLDALRLKDSTKVQHLEAVQNLSPDQKITRKTNSGQIESLAKAYCVSQGVPLELADDIKAPMRFATTDESSQILSGKKQALPLAMDEFLNFIDEGGDASLISAGRMISENEAQAAMDGL